MRVCLPRCLVVSVALCALDPLTAAASAPPNVAAAPTSRLRVGILEDPPFATKIDGKWQGLTVDIWDAIGRRTDIAVDWVPVTRRDVADHLTARAVDVGPALTLTTDRVRAMNFTPPILSSGVAIATIENAGWDWRAMLDNLRTSGILRVFGAIVLTNVVIGFGLWLIERRQNPANFGGPARQGFASGVWCSISTMTTVGYGDKVPVTWPGRVLCFVVMLSGVIVISLFTAAATSALTVAHLRPRVRNAEDLRHAVSVAIDGSAGAEYLRRHSLPALTVPDWASAVDALEHGTAAAFVHNRVELLAGLRHHAGHVVVLPLNLEEDFYAFPLSTDPAVQRRVSIALQEFLDSADWDRIEAAYLGE